MTPAAAALCVLLSGRVGAGLVTGTWRLDGGPREDVRGGRVGAEVEVGPWRFAWGYRGVWHAAEGAARAAQHAAGVLAGYEGAWVGAALGPGLTHGVTEGATRVAPALALRLGPRDLVFVEARELALTEGPGLWRLGVGAAAGAGRVWAGGVWEHATWGLGAAGALPLSERLEVTVGAAVNPGRASELVLIEAGLGLRL